jgi:hypothetical protein
MIKNLIKKFQPYLIYSLVFSIFFIEKIKYKSLSIYEFIFVILFLFFINKILKFDFKKFLNIENFSLIFIIIIILYKYLYYDNYLYPVLVTIFLIITYFLFLFLIIDDGLKKKTYSILRNSFQIIYIISCLMVMVFYFFKSLGFLFDDFWYTREDIFPYLNYATIHFKGFYTSYNYQAYIMVPGYFYLLEKIFLRNNKINLIFFVLLSFCVFFIVKAKVFFLIICLTIFYLLNNYIRLNKIFFYLFLLMILLSYILISHFIPSKIEMVGSEYKHYFTDAPIFIIDNILIYGSLFYKIKSLIIQDIGFLNLIPHDRDFYIKHNTDPHSVYFLLLYNYGILSLICFLLFLFSIIKKFNLLFFKRSFKFLLIDYTIFMIFLIEGFNKDINSYRFFWITTSMLLGVLYVHKKKK